VATLLDVHRAAAQVEGVLRAVVAGVGAALAGLALVTALVLVGWAAPSSDSNGASIVDALRIAGLGWLAAHHVPLQVPSGLVAWLPLGLLVVPLTATYSAGRWLARRSSGTGFRLACVRIIAMSVTYAAIAACVAVLASRAEVKAVPAVAAASGIVIAGIAGAVGMPREERRDASRWRLPAAARASIAAGAVGLFALVGGGAVLVIVAVVTQRAAVGSVITALDAGIVGSVLVLLVSAAYVPNIVIWAMAWAVGPGFAVGAGTSVSPLAVEVGPLPALPLFGVLPPPGPPPALSLLALFVPLTAGVIVGRVLARRLPGRGWTMVLWASAAAGVAGLGVAVLAVLSGGPLGGGRLAVVGPSPWPVAAAAALEIGIVAAPIAWFTSRRLR
jgi:hypothetical protein